MVGDVVEVVDLSVVVVVIELVGTRRVVGGCVGSELVSAEVLGVVVNASGTEVTLAGEELTVDAIVDAALVGDPVARQVVHEAAEHLGIAVAGIVSMLNPAMVIVGGGLTRVGDLLLEPLRDVIGRRSMITSVAGTELRAGDLGEQRTALGAATLVLQAALDNPRLFPQPQVARPQ